MLLLTLLLILSAQVHRVRVPIFVVYVKLTKKALKVDHPLSYTAEALEHDTNLQLLQMFSPFLTCFNRAAILGDALSCATSSGQYCVLP